MLPYRSYVCIWEKRKYVSLQIMTSIRIKNTEMIKPILIASSAMIDLKQDYMMLNCAYKIEIKFRKANNNNLIVRNQKNGSDMIKEIAVTKPALKTNNSIIKDKVKVRILSENRKNKLELFLKEP